MENLVASVHHQRKPTKKSSKTKTTTTKPIKVVYISTPMKVKTCASNFRALVQELTGQDAALPDPTKFIHSKDDDDDDNDDDDTSLANNQTVQLLDADESDDHHAVLDHDEVPIVDPCPSRHYPHLISTDFSFQSTFEDDDFTKLDNFSGLFSSGLFESSQVDVL